MPPYWPAPHNESTPWFAPFRAGDPRLQSPRVQEILTMQALSPNTRPEDVPKILQHLQPDPSVIIPDDVSLHRPPFRNRKARSHQTPKPATALQLSNEGLGSIDEEAVPPRPVWRRAEAEKAARAPGGGGRRGVIESWRDAVLSPDGDLEPGTLTAAAAAAAAAANPFQQNLLSEPTLAAMARHKPMHSAKFRAGGPLGGARREGNAARGGQKQDVFGLGHDVGSQMPGSASASASGFGRAGHGHQQKHDVFGLGHDVGSQMPARRGKGDGRRKQRDL